MICKKHNGNLWLWLCSLNFGPGRYLNLLNMIVVFPPSFNVLTPLRRQIGHHITCTYSLHKPNLFDYGLRPDERWFIGTREPLPNIDEVRKSDFPGSTALGGRTRDFVSIVLVKQRTLVT